MRKQGLKESALLLVAFASLLMPSVLVAGQPEHGLTLAPMLEFTALPSPQVGQTPTAEALAAAIDHHYNTLRSLSVDFTQQYNGMGLSRTESGTLLLRKAGRLASAGQMRWTYSKPAGKLFILDGHDAYFYTPGQSEIPRVPAKKLDDIRSPLAFLLGRASLTKQLAGLKIERVGIYPGTLMLSGVPRGMEKRVAVVAISAKEDGTITMLRVEETDGAINNFDLKNEQPNVPAPASAFTFTPPPGTHVIDGMPPL